MLEVRKFSVLLLLFFALAKTGLAQGQYQVVSVSNGGTIKGAVSWSGPVPRPVVLAISKDPQICDPESLKTRDLERLIIGPQHGVANTVVYLKNISSGKAMDLPEPRRFLDQKHCRYEPHILLVPQGALLQMKSSDATLHTVHMDGAATYNLPFPFTNQVISRTMPTSGLVNLKCNGGHLWMNAVMFVASHPYYAVTDESGTFELTDVPPGDYELVAWHEGWGVARKENTLDVLTQQRVQRPIFTEPRTWEKKISVTPNKTTAASFIISDK
jgi:Polysaccharide lyase family 4, domain II